MKRVWVFAAVVGCALPVAAQDPSDWEESIWEEAVHTQPFDGQPFQPIRIPTWVEETTGVGYTLSVQNAEQRQRSVDLGVTISEMGFVDPLYVYYDSRLLKRRSPHVPQAPMGTQRFAGTNGDTALCRVVHITR